jgi:hypothetical protein
MAKPLPQPTRATYEEVIAILSEMARKGDVRAAIALAGHLRKEAGESERESAIDELAGRRARAS